MKSTYTIYTYKVFGNKLPTIIQSVFIIIAIALLLCLISSSHGNDFLIWLMNFP